VIPANPEYVANADRKSLNHPGTQQATGAVPVAIN
jgi:hypothetical protein